jgi:hypothetical protein
MKVIQKIGFKTLGFWIIISNSLMNIRGIVFFGFEPCEDILINGPKFLNLVLQSDKP